MTSRERLLCVLNNEIPDRVPVSLFVQEEYLSYYYNKPNADRLYDAINLRKELDFDLISRQNILLLPYFFSKSYENWNVTIETEVKDGNFIKTTTLVTPKKTLVQKEGCAYNPNNTKGVHLCTLEYLIKDREDFEVFKEFLPKMDQEDKDYILEKGREAKSLMGDLGITCPWSVGGVYNLVSTYIDVQDMLVDALVEEEYYAEYMELFLEIVCENYRVFAESDFDAVGIQGNIANGAIMGSDYFSEHVLPYENRALQILSDANKPTIYHNCGNAKSLYKAYESLNVSVWETIAAPNQGDNNLKEAKAYFGDKLILSGNFDQVSFLKTATPDEVYKKAQEVMLDGKEGGHYIFACSDYLEVDTPVENVKALIAGAKSVSEY